MIRVRKSTESPESLAAHGYRDENVRRAIHADQDGKCYLCERHMHTDIQVEHRQSREHSPELTNVWTNLFLSCSYCNGKKLANYDSILDPTQYDIEALIRHSYDAEHGRFSFEAVGVATSAIQSTIDLLDLIFNGTRPGLLKIKEEEFRRDFQSVHMHFNDLLADYLRSPTAASENAVREELHIGREFLGFKYWKILSDEKLAIIFRDDIVWNKVDNAIAETP